LANLKLQLLGSTVVGCIAAISMPINSHSGKSTAISYLDVSIDLEQFIGKTFTISQTPVPVPISMARRGWAKGA
jgi:hypothetical protein